jgi:microcystin-dependent protein
MTDPFIGEIACEAFDYPPVGWLPCDGRLLSIGQYSPLYSLIGTTYGGDGINNFAVPDLRGRVLVGVGTGTGLSPVALGNRYGADTVTLSADELPVHTHNVSAAESAGRAGTQNPSGCVYAGNPAAAIWAPAPTAPAAMNAAMLASSGGSQAHDNRMPYLVLNYYIAYQGIFPSRE